ncbi:uncharacterized protein DEA37_0013112, partial [Paragonimus westermani]
PSFSSKSFHYRLPCWTNRHKTNQCRPKSAGSISKRSTLTKIPQLQSTRTEILTNPKATRHQCSLRLTRQCCRVLWFVCRLAVNFFCLIPSCLCHWFRGSQRSKCIKRSNSFLFYLYVTIKLLYLFNLIGQLLFMKLFLGTDSYFFGFHVLRDLIYGRVWSQTGNFPRVTYCDFETKKTGKNYK